MLNIIHACERFGIRTTTVCGAVQDARTLIEYASDGKRKAEQFFEAIGVVVVVDNAIHGRVLVQAAVEAAIAHQGDIADEALFAQQISIRASNHIKDPNFGFVFAPSSDAFAPATASFDVMKEVAGLSIAHKGNTGEIKRGGKKQIAEALYLANVINAAVPMSNQDFAALLVKEAGMTKSGAATYMYNLKKQFSTAAVL